MSKSDLYFQRTCRNHFWLGGEKAQEKLKSLRVGIAGLGGMGSGVALTLARLGVTKFTLADPDVVEITNLNRQVIADHTTIGKTKLNATVEALKKIDPEIEIEGFDQGITDESIELFLKDVDVVIDEIDVFPVDAHKTLHKEARKRNLDLYSAYVIGLGIHLYRFTNNHYKLDDFYQPIYDSTESLAEGLIQTFVRPEPEYFKGNSLSGYTSEVESGNVPIFGPSCLLGHSLVSMRMVLDYMQSKNLELPFSYEQTPCMPEYIVVDPITFSISKHSLEKDHNLINLKSS